MCVNLNIFLSLDIKPKKKLLISFILNNRFLGEAYEYVNQNRCFFLR